MPIAETTSDELSVPGPIAAVARPPEPAAIEPPPAFGATAMIAFMMYMQHALPASWSTILPLHVQDLGFSRHEIGHIFGVISLAPLIAPWIGGQLADRVFTSQTVIIICNLLNAVVLWAASYQTQFWPLLILCSLSSTLWIPTFALTTHIAMRHLHRTPQNFGSIRLFGTAGWVSTTLLIGFWIGKPEWLPGGASATLSDGFRISAVWSLLATVVCALSPRTPPEPANGSPRFAAASAAKVLRDPQVFAVLLAGILLALTIAFVNPMGGLFLRSLGVADSRIPPIVATGQMVELVAFASIAMLVRRIGFKWLFAIGVAMWSVRMTIFAIGDPLPLVILAFASHGICYAWTVGLSNMIIAERCPPDARATAQSLYLVLTVGIPTWPSNQFAAWLSETCSTMTATGATAVNYHIVFIVPAVACAACLALFIALFPSTRPLAARTPR